MDADSDGYTSDVDCEDDNWFVNPGTDIALANETWCRFRTDKNCDGRDDFFEDWDGDGFSSCDLDCDDFDPTRHPGADDPLDGVDSNCDGTDGVGEPATLLGLGSRLFAGLGSTLLRADVNGDGCDDLVVSESGLTSHAIELAGGQDEGWLHAWIGCTDPQEIVTLQDTPGGSNGIGQRLLAWPTPGGDLLLECNNFVSYTDGGALGVIDFTLDSPLQTLEIFGSQDFNNDACAIVDRGTPEIVVNHIEQFGSGPAKGFALPVQVPSLLAAPDTTWWDFADDRHLGWEMLGWDRTGDGLDELLACATWYDPLEAQAGTFYVLDGPGVANAREVWHGDLALGTFFGCRMAIAPDLPAPGDRGLLVGGELLNDTGTLYVLPPVPPGDYSVADAAFELRGEFDSEWFGAQSRVGDVNGDGHTDIVVGAPWDLDAIDPLTGGPGKVYVFLGPFDGSELTRADARVFVGGMPHDGFGWAVELADLDGDGTPEIYVGAPSDSHVYFAQPGGHDGALYRIDL